MSKIIVRNTKTGVERPMTRKSFEYLSAKNRGFEFVREDVQEKPADPKKDIIEQEKARLRAEKEAAKAFQVADSPVQEQPVKTETRGRKPKNNEA